MAPGSIVSRTCILNPACHGVCGEGASVGGGEELLRVEHWLRSAKCSPLCTSSLGPHDHSVRFVLLTRFRNKDGAGSSPLRKVLEPGPALLSPLCFGVRALAVGMTRS